MKRLIAVLVPVSAFRRRLRFVFVKLWATGGRAELIARSTSQFATLRHLRTWQDLVRYLFSSEKVRRQEQRSGLDEIVAIHVATRLMRQEERLA